MGKSIINNHQSEMAGGILMKGEMGMAKDDMDVIIYKILRYMYERVKRGETPRLEDMCYDCKLFHIPEGYWNQIIVELAESGYVRGFLCRRTKSGLVVTMMDDVSITLAGVHFLEENSRMRKAGEFLGKAFEIVLGTILTA